MKRLALFILLLILFYLYNLQVHETLEPGMTRLPPSKIDHRLTNSPHLCYEWFKRFFSVLSLALTRVFLKLLTLKLSLINLAFPTKTHKGKNKQHLIGWTSIYCKHKIMHIYTSFEMFMWSCGKILWPSYWNSSCPPCLQTGKVPTAP